MCVQGGCKGAGVPGGAKDIAPTCVSWSSCVKRSTTDDECVVPSYSGCQLSSLKACCTLGFRLGSVVGKRVRARARVRVRVGVGARVSLELKGLLHVGRHHLE